MGTHHVVYESQPHSVIVTLGDQLYRVPEVVPTISILLISKKQCLKVISHTKNFSLFTIWSEGEQKDTVTAISLAQDIYVQQK
jgi:hypothetical protein